ncbi:spermidine synthase [Marinimicrobium sp. ABcell2]|uniref:spermidine synthase n=1 Tax=Marinimicrobium sp. ABcell2 TaxID=3069751 RepID=UPI0027AE9394|nr:spermidine synthase [Marinimicrobium sp. ABcell2]MDQ2076915.1 spermidine synthase [Marinimicrobium sp. ABcell2]
MSRLFEEIDTQQTAIGEISLRRRRIPALGPDYIYEVKLGEEYLMSSMFVDAEVALSELGLEALEGDNLTVVVGGLGLGYTADAALKDQRVSEMLVVEALEPVIGWHQQGKVPLGEVLSQDPRCRYVHANFFEAALSSFDPEAPGRQFDGIFLDIDHSPQAHLHSENAGFYTVANLSRMRQQLRPGGVFAMWSNEPADEAFMDILRQVFGNVRSEVVEFFNPFQNRNASNTIYLAANGND